MSNLPVCPQSVPSPLDLESGASAPGVGREPDTLRPSGSPCLIDFGTEYSHGDSTRTQYPAAGPNQAPAGRQRDPHVLWVRVAVDADERHRSRETRVRASRSCFERFQGVRAFLGGGGLEGSNRLLACGRNGSESEPPNSAAETTLHLRVRARDENSANLRGSGCEVNR